MKAQDFCYWLQGFFEIEGARPPLVAGGLRAGLSPEQVDMISRHLELVFVHDIDPQYGNKEHQAVLQAVHDGPTPPARPNGARC